MQILIYSLNIRMSFLRPSADTNADELQIFFNQVDADGDGEIQQAEADQVWYVPHHVGTCSRQQFLKTESACGGAGDHSLWSCAVERVWRTWRRCILARRSSVMEAPPFRRQSSM